ncbi:MAG: 50S ribosomal protein L17 [Bacteroidetes bacterium]|nr:50S ribosomal protein L17 [Bacteroidota bacterium]
MVHRKKGRKLQRTASHRKALLSNLSISLILNKRIKTTEAKAKELRRFIEPLVSKAKKALKFQDSSPERSIHLRREARKFLNNKEALIILFDEIGAKVGDRPGGFTRVLKTGNRYGDGAKTAIIEFVDYNYVKDKEAKDTEKAEVSDDKSPDKGDGAKTKASTKEAKTTKVKESKPKESKAKETKAKETKGKTVKKKKEDAEDNKDTKEKKTVKRKKKEDN